MVYMFAQCVILLCFCPIMLFVSLAAIKGRNLVRVGRVHSTCVHVWLLMSWKSLTQTQNKPSQCVCVCVCMNVCVRPHSAFTIVLGSKQEICIHWPLFLSCYCFFHCLFSTKCHHTSLFTQHASQ